VSPERAPSSGRDAREAPCWPRLLNPNHWCHNSPAMKLPVPKRRHALALAAASAAWVACAPRALRAEAKHPDQRWYAKAREMKELAESWGDQSYGAVVVLGSRALSGSVLYSTSRPCALCEEAAARAGASRMYHGPTLTDAGPPKLRNE
jgi:hypothetical protein